MQAGEWKTGEVTLSVNGAPLKLKITVPAKRVKPQVMLPIFQQLANAFTDLGVSTVTKAGQTISCQKGCGACCRQPVPLAEVEIYYIALLVDYLPEPRQTEVRERFKAATAHLHSIGWYEAFDACSNEEDLKNIVREYFSQAIPCPFLEDESCSIHPHRPIACREYMVTSPKEACAKAIESTLSQIPLPIYASRGLRNIAPSNNLKKGFLPMVFALDWATQHPEEFPEKTGEEWLSDFFTK